MKGIRQEDTISPKLLTTMLEEIFHEMNWEDQGININGKFYPICVSLKTVLSAKHKEDLHKRLQEFNQWSDMTCLRINIDKTKIMLDNSVLHTE
jgi:hypothetical protein